MFNKQKFNALLDGTALPHPSLHCSHHVDIALEAAGFDISSHPRDAKDYGPYLMSLGFYPVSGIGYRPEDGDVVVIQPPDHPVQAQISPAGHVAAYDGRQWVSDFRQKDMWGGPYRNDGLSYQIYRYD